MNTLNDDSRIFVAGHSGLVGTALVRALRAQGYQNLITPSHSELDLTSFADTQSFFASERPTHVLMAAAKVGGIYANDSRPVEFLALKAGLLGFRIRHDRRVAVFGSDLLPEEHLPVEPAGKAQRGGLRMPIEKPLRSELELQAARVNRPPRPRDGL